LDRFPHFYRVWDEKSVISKVVRSCGKRLDECEGDIGRVLRSRWVDTARGGHLDMLGHVYSMGRRVNETDGEFRNRLKTAIQGFKGGGTINAIANAVRIMLGLSFDYPIRIVENPQKKVVKKVNVKTGEVWRMSSESISDAKPKIKIEVGDEEGFKGNGPEVEVND